MYRCNVIKKLCQIRDNFMSFTHRGENILVKRTHIETNLHVKMFLQTILNSTLKYASTTSANYNFIFNSAMQSSV